MAQALQQPFHWQGNQVFNAFPSIKSFHELKIDWNLLFCQHETHLETFHHEVLYPQIRGTKRSSYMASRCLSTVSVQWTFIPISPIFFRFLSQRIELDGRQSFSYMIPVD